MFLNKIKQEFNVILGKNPTEITNINYGKSYLIYKNKNKIPETGGNAINKLLKNIKIKSIWDKQKVKFLLT